MTKQDFLLFYPQFSGIPDAVIEDCVHGSNERFDYLDSDAELARRLWIAHRLTLYAMTAASVGASSEVLASAGDNTLVTGKHVGELSVSYGARGNAATNSDLALTTYGLQLVPLLKLNSYSRYVK